MTGDAPSVYWRLGERTGALVSDTSGHGRAAAYASPAEQRTRTGALVGDDDRGVVDARAWYSSAYDLIRAPLSVGLPSAASARTLEAWIWSDAPGARPLAYGDFSFELEERTIVAAGKRFTLPADDDRRITDGRWHHVAVSYDGTSLTAYLDGARLGEPIAATLNTSTAGELFGARIPAGATVVYDELALYPRALDAATVKTHFDASGNAAAGGARRRQRHAGREPRHGHVGQAPRRRAGRAARGRPLRRRGARREPVRRRRPPHRHAQRPARGRRRG